MNTLQEFINHKMKGLRFELVINADTENNLIEALQAAIDDIGQGNMNHGSATDEWAYSYRLDGKAIEEFA